MRPKHVPGLSAGAGEEGGHGQKPGRAKVSPTGADRRGHLRCFKFEDEVVTRTGGGWRSKMGQV